MLDLLKIFVFTDIKQCKIGNSKHKDLIDIESHGKTIGEEFNTIETMIIEAQKQVS